MMACHKNFSDFEFWNQGNALLFPISNCLFERRFSSSFDFANNIPKITKNQLGLFSISIYLPAFL